jgi:hypothetical protein
MSLMRNLKDRVRQLGPQQALTLPLVPGPAIEKISGIIDRTGYQLEVTVGQRKYHAPESAGLSDPTHGHEVRFYLFGLHKKQVIFRFTLATSRANFLRTR